ncbi:hypothetical protein AALP_AA7G111400 [Arabis alpina]|uniref:Uncharacterized protein n=1 Tax=Arabis alpina TaxID=50452 RepID=A0A087GHB8_ARAAL|nr:hypothetical protein AALP_AA7G111400 [Arabis alpina]
MRPVSEKNIVDLDQILLLDRTCLHEPSSSCDPHLINNESCRLRRRLVQAVNL